MQGAAGSVPGAESGTQRTGEGHVVLASADSRGFVSLRETATPRQERYALGKALRKQVPRSSLGAWTATAHRPDTIDQIKE
ncbi:MAG TPA: hypothetical protein VGP03_08050, partial [Pseudonocardiaceae bacterium]|nr:hypothetical protein [Pseudonocardiaceae bacterium]